MNRNEKEETPLGKELERAGFDPDGVRQLIALKYRIAACLGMGMSIGWIIVGAAAAGMSITNGWIGLLIGAPMAAVGTIAFIVCRKIAKAIKHRGKQQ